MFVIPTIKHGGAELFLLRLCEMSQNSYEICLVVIGEREGLFKDFEALDIRIHYLGFKDLRYFPIAVLRLRHFMRMESPSIVQSFLYLADILSGVASIGLKIHLTIWSLRGSVLAAGTSYHKLVIQRVAAFLSTRIPDLIISCSNQVSEFHIKLGYPVSKIITIGNFVSNWAINAKSGSSFLTEAYPGHFKIGLAARYDLGKGHHALLETALNFLRNKPNTSITLSFCGKGCEVGGRLSSDFRRSLENEDLFKNGRLKVVMAGLLHGQSLIHWFEELDLYFMSSDSLEGFPNSLAEAIAIGLPSLATPIGAARDFLPNERLSEFTTSKSMSELLERYYEEELHNKKKVTKQLREYILMTYRDDKIFASYISAWKI
jgi:glycosyltransferase involved in cell wall biosynthesis